MLGLLRFRKKSHPAAIPMIAATGIPTPRLILAPVLRLPSFELEEDAEAEVAVLVVAEEVASVGRNEVAVDVLDVGIVDPVDVEVVEDVVVELVEEVDVSSEVILRKTVQSSGAVPPDSYRLIMNRFETVTSKPRGFTLKGKLVVFQALPSDGDAVVSFHCCNYLRGGTSEVWDLRVMYLSSPKGSPVVELTCHKVTVDVAPSVPVDQTMFNSENSTNVMVLPKPASPVER